MDVFLVDSLRKLCLWRRSFTFWAGVRGTLPFNRLWQHSDKEQIRSLSHFLMISRLYLPTLCFKRLSRGANLANRSHRLFMVELSYVYDFRVTYYFLIYSYCTSPGKTPVLSLSLSSVSCFISIKRYPYGLHFLNDLIINELLPGYIWRTRLATLVASRAFLNMTM